MLNTPIVDFYDIKKNSSVDILSRSGRLGLFPACFYFLQNLIFFTKANFLSKQLVDATSFPPFRDFERKNFE